MRKRVGGRDLSANVQGAATEHTSTAIASAVENHSASVTVSAVRPTSRPDLKGISFASDRPRPTHPWAGLHGLVGTVTPPLPTETDFGIWPYPLCWCWLWFLYWTNIFCLTRTNHVAKVIFVPRAPVSGLWHR